MARFVLVHGAWHGSWCFAELEWALERRHHEVVRPELPSDQVGLTPVNYARMLGPQPDAVVVGHSLAGQTIGLMEAHRRVYLAAILPIVDQLSEAFAPGFGGFERDEQGRSYWPDARTAAARLYPDCTPEQVEWAFPQLPPQASFEAVRTPFGAGDVVVAATRDAIIDPGWLMRAAVQHGAELHAIDAGHFPMLTHPDELASILSGLA